MNLWMIMIADDITLIIITVVSSCETIMSSRLYNNLVWLFIFYNNRVLKSDTDILLKSIKGYFKNCGF